MRNSLSELPVLLSMIRGGLIAGFFCALALLPRKLSTRFLRGRRANPVLRMLFGALEAAAGVSAAAFFAYTLIRSNGGEPRAYAVFGFIAAGAVSACVLNGLIDAISN